jgi:hypothetical protein
MNKPPITRYWLGKHLPTWVRNKISETKKIKGDNSGSKNYFYKDGGKTKICLNCKKEFRVKTSQFNIRKFCSYKCKGDWMSENVYGEKHHSWQGGKSKDKHCSTKKYKQWRTDIFKRDNWTCQTCGVRGCYIEPHHIKSWAKFPELRFEISNGVTLCLSCHKLTDNYKGKNV